VITRNDSNVLLEYPNDDQILIKNGASLTINREQLSDDTIDELEFITDEVSVSDILDVLNETAQWRTLNLMSASSRCL
ncbi:hypothetical protein R0K04_23610, partial [Pseudoalteromonas sp. SIMBA_153]